MNSNPVLKKKQTGVMLIILGGFIVLIVGVFLYFNAVKIPGFPEFLTAKNTNLYVEFPSALPEDIAQSINKILKIDWNKDILPWAADRAAVALVDSSPFVLVQVKDAQKAAQFLKTESPKAGSATVGGQTVYFSFLSDILVVSPSFKALENLLKSPPIPALHLSNDADFIKIKGSFTEPFFAYFKPKEMPAFIWSFVGKYVPHMPEISLSFRAIGVAVEKTENGWRGGTYAVSPNFIPVKTQQPYRAALLPLLPLDSGMVISGQDLGGQLDKIRATAETLYSFFEKEYLPGIALNKITALAAREFALSVNQNKILFVTEIFSPDLKKNIDELRSAFKSASANFTSREQEVTLPDGTPAKELVTNPPQIKPFAEKFQGADIQGFEAGDWSVYDALIQNKWFVSNDLATLKKSILLTIEPGPSFRDTENYKKILQPILKNPELAGFSLFRKFAFGFSKHTFADHMEAAFSVVIQ